MHDDFRVAVVCSSNMNRSMEAHSVLKKKGFRVCSFGTGDKVKLPGTALDKPNVYNFSCSYDEIYKDLVKKDKAFYTQNGLLHLLNRNKRVKPKPERFQLCKDRFDLIITCEERVYDQVLEYFFTEHVAGIHEAVVVNVDILDNPEDATLGSFIICDIVALAFLKVENGVYNIEDVLQTYKKKNKKDFMYSVVYYK